MKLKRTHIALVLCAVMLFTLGCAAKSSVSSGAMYSEPAAAYDGAMMEESADYAPMPESAAGEAVSNNAVEQTGDFNVRKIVYTANMNLTTDDPALSLDTLVAKAKALGGYVSGSYTSTDERGANYATATLKVPAEKLDELITAANELGKVDDYRLSSDDISLSYYDMQARLDNAKAEEQQLLEILAKCETVEDILAVRESLTRVRSDIESYTAQMNLWDNLVAYATLNVNISRTPLTAVEGEKDLIQLWKASDVWDKMSRGFTNSLRFIVNAVGAIGIFIAVAAIPVGLLFLLIGLPIILHKKNKRKKAAALRAQQGLAPEPDNTVKKKE